MTAPTKCLKACKTYKEREREIKSESYDKGGESKLKNYSKKLVSLFPL